MLTVNPTTAIINRLKRYWLNKQQVVSERKTLSKASKMPIFPTTFGAAMLVVLVVMFIWSANHQLNLGYFLTFLVATMVMLSASLTVSYLAQLEIIVQRAPAVFLGEEARFHLRISETNGRPRPGFSVSNAWHEQWVGAIDAHATVQVSIAQPTTARGWQSMDDLEIKTTLPMGFFVSWHWFYLNKHVLVYPQPKGDLPLPYEQQAEQGAEELLLDYGEDEFAGLKTYTLGDSLSRVAWKQAGRGEDLMLKVFHGQGAQSIVLNDANLQGDLEARLSQLTQWVLQAEKNRVPYALILANARIEKGLGEAHCTRCLETLALYEG